MCGRFTITTDGRTLQERFNFDLSGLDAPPSYNVAPTQQVLTVVRSVEGVNEGRMMRWGLIPRGSKGQGKRGPLINVRAESLLQRGLFRSALERRRCLVPADGFFEWRKAGRERIPLYFTLKDQRPFALAGLRERWTSPNGEEIQSCAVITVQANGLLEPIHDRMPVILSQDSEETWLDREVNDLALLNELLLPYSATEMAWRQVSSGVNSVKAAGPECIGPPEGSSAQQGTLSL